MTDVTLSERKRTAASLAFAFGYNFSRKGLRRNFFALKKAFFSWGVKVDPKGWITKELLHAKKRSPFFPQLQQHTDKQQYVSMYMSV